MNTGTLEKLTTGEDTAVNKTIRQPRVVIIGAGFAGLSAAKALRNAPVKVTVIDRRNHHLFQPQLYQVAIASLSPADIAEPLRRALGKQRNVEVMLGEVTGVDTREQRVLMQDRAVPYDYLLVATGAQYNYFGHEEWRQYALSLKSLEDATAIRRSILLSFEAAAMETDPEKQRALLTFVVIGAGPAGVEMSSQLAELTKKLLASDFRHLDPSLLRILLVEAGPRILPPFPESLAKSAHEALLRQGVEVKTGAAVQEVDAEGVVIAGKHLAARTVIWLAGVKASPASSWLDAASDNVGRVKVQSDLSIDGHANIFVIGDTAQVMQEGAPLPGLAPVAIQEGSYVATVIAERVAGKEHAQGFHYRNQGKIATAGRFFAVAELGKVHLTGLPAWLVWTFIHSFFLIGFRKRFIVALQWGLAYMSLNSRTRLIVGRPGTGL